LLQRRIFSGKLFRLEMLSYSSEDRFLSDLAAEVYFKLDEFFAPFGNKAFQNFPDSLGQFYRNPRIRWLVS